jgi:hypothetical protein
MRGLAWAHPVAMLAVLALGLWVLREGLRVRRARLRGRPVDAARHRRLGRWFVPLAAAGFLAGLGSAVGLRPDLGAYGSLHAWVMTGAVAGLLGAGGLGLRLERGARLAARRAHLICGAGGLLAALGGAVAGFAILP